MILPKLGSNFWQMWYKKQKNWHKLIHTPKFQPCRVSVPNDLVEKKPRRLSSKFFLEFKEKLGLDPSKYSLVEQDSISVISDINLHLKGKLRIINTVFKTKDLIFIFLNINLQ